MAYTGGTVKIIPAAALRDQQYWYDPAVAAAASYAHDVHQFASASTAYPIPINAAFYGGAMYNAGAYMHEPYGQNAFIDPAAYGDPQSYPYYGGYSYAPYYPQGQAYGRDGQAYSRDGQAYARDSSQAYQQQQAQRENQSYVGGASAGTAYPGAYGPYPGASGAYRPYPQPQPSPPRRSRTAPSRPAQRQSAATVYPSEQARRSRGYSADPYERRQFKAYAGANKKPQPMYKKRREPTLTRINPQHQETEFGGGPVDYSSQFNKPYYPEGDQTLRRMRPFYAPSYTTYPPSTMHRHAKKMNTSRYPLFARIIVKLAQLCLGAAILGLVLGPMKGNSFYDFVVRTNTEWQGVVVGLVTAWTVLAAILLLTSFLANSKHAWRKVDAHITLFGILGYLAASCLEAYYANCYPPNGPRLNLVCHRAEWIIACILCFINTVIYVFDFTMSWFAGVSML